MPPRNPSIKPWGCYDKRSMKLRILADSVRLRLSQSDLRQLAEHGRVQETTHFGPDATLTYALVVDSDNDRVAASFADGTMTVSLPQGVARAWIDTEQVGIEAVQPLAEQAALRLLIEKDFQCLVPRAGEDDADGFPNPKA